MAGTPAHPCRRRPASLAPAVLLALAAAIGSACRSRDGDSGARPSAAAPVAASASGAAAPPPPRPADHPPRIDVHMHISPVAIDRALALMDRWGIDGAVNLTGIGMNLPPHLVQMQAEALRQARGRIAAFATVDFLRAVRFRPKDYGAVLAQQLEAAKQVGAIGLKISKGLGLGYPAPDGKTFLRVDDAGLDPLFAKAGELDMPVAIHTGDPKAFWQPATPANERWDELQAHPEWSFHGKAENGTPWPAWEALYAQFERRVARHPKTTFIGVHFGNAPEEPARVARMLDRYPNLYIDTAARVPEIGRHAADKMRAFFVKYQDRVLLGTDTGVGESQDEMMYGSTGELPPTAADEARFFASTRRYFETSDKQFESPTPIQGRWKIDGVGLPPDVLRKIYFENAARVLKWRPSLTRDERTP